jgi:hypothetical protein
LEIQVLQDSLEDLVLSVQLGQVVNQDQPDRLEHLGRQGQLDNKVQMDKLATLE